MHRTRSELVQHTLTYDEDQPQRNGIGNGQKNGHTIAQETNKKTSVGMIHSVSWPVFPPTLSKEEMPVIFRQPYVEKGFRALNQPWWYYFPLSIFQLHNESMNVWTHLLAMALMTRKLYLISFDVNFMEDPYTWPLLAGYISGTIVYACSIAAHSMQAKSELVHYTAFMFDYAGIGMYGLGISIMNLAYCSEDEFYNLVNAFFIPIAGLFALLICVCSSFAKVNCTPYSYVRKAFQAVPITSQCLFAISPLFLRCYFCYYHESAICNHNESLPYHITQFLLFVLSGFFFASDVPQRLRPGSCDHFFHSHQIFHITMMICTIIQYEGIFIDYKTRKNIILVRPVPTLVGVFGPIVVVALLDILFIVMLNRKIRSKMIKREH